MNSNLKILLVSDDRSEQSVNAQINAAMVELGILGTLTTVYTLDSADLNLERHRFDCLILDVSNDTIIQAWGAEEILGFIENHRLKLPLIALAETAALDRDNFELTWAGCKKVLARSASAISWLQEIQQLLLDEVKKEPVKWPHIAALPHQSTSKSAMAFAFDATRISHCFLPGLTDVEFTMNWLRRSNTTHLAIEVPKSSNTKENQLIQAALLEGIRVGIWVSYDVPEELRELPEEYFYTAMVPRQVEEGARAFANMCWEEWGKTNKL